LRYVLLILTFILGSCASAPISKRPQRVQHVYLEPVTNRTSEESLDVIFTRVANDVFSSDPRLKVDTRPIPDVTIVVKPSVDYEYETAVGFDKWDTAREYRLTVGVTVKLFKYGFKEPFKTFKLRRYGFFDAYGSASEIEEKKRECFRRIANQIFRETSEKMFVETKGKTE
jgi:hypothetical protein